MWWIFGVPFFILGISNNNWSFVIIGIALSVVFYTTMDKKKQKK